ncbi:probable LRR receptor-like serine/threonine-protein kinase IRK [Cynara cardunculus var. scolymus]|uniref:probable LRR receptor-like serine/threonine-protein kinase IRK n=1 Tax=Cynara cardunculus var. scolymus TaxID=59895 RepID=UPI000D62A6B6|nr:probable LRR receptor-like serine/threonine-protein kinase IRK [Cynara cardunculus var. scolymus]
MVNLIIELRIEKPEVADKRTEEDILADKLLIDIIDRESNVEESKSLKLYVKSETIDLFTFSNNEFEEEGDFNMINKLNEEIPESPDREQHQPESSVHQMEQHVRTENIRSLKLLDISSNGLVGPIPEYGFGNLIELDRKTAQHDHSCPTQQPAHGSDTIIDTKLEQVKSPSSSKQQANRRNPNWVIQNLTNLQILDLSGNKLTGSIPVEIENLTRTIETPVHMSTSGPIIDTISNLYISPFFDLIHIDIEDLIVNWKNYFQGLSSHSLDIYSLLDFSNNRISSEIPESLGNLKSLKELNISNNNISGHIPVSSSNLKGIESLDLSHSKISSSIPKSLAKLGELAILDVSNNKLTGKIPVGEQMNTINELKYFANNNGLCGMQIMIQCPEDILPSEGIEIGEDDEKLSWIFWVGSWIGILVGFFLSILIMGYSLDFLQLFKIW